MLSALVTTVVACTTTSAPAPSSLMTFRVGARTVCSLGDVDGDRCADVVLAQPCASNSGTCRGLVQVFSGQTGRKLYELWGEHELQHFGTAVCSIPDIDGDGIRELAIGAPGPLLVVGERALEAGSVTIVSGVDGRVLHRIEGRERGDRFGADVRLVGDLDRDGIRDWIIGAPGANNLRGRAAVYSGRTRELLLDIEGESVGELLGMSVNGAGDVNGDGIDDVILGATSERRGIARIYSGIDGCELFELDGGCDECFFGCAVAGVGDVDGDGRADVIVGADRRDSTGQVLVYSGGVGTVIGCALSTDRWLGHSFGSVLDVVPDVDGDGVNDWIVGDPAENPGEADRGQSTGAFSIVSGRTRRILFEQLGERSFQSLGFAVAGAGDTNGDGIDDFLVADHPWGAVSSTLYVYSGVDCRLLRRMEL